MTPPATNQLTDLIIQFFDDVPRRPTSLFGLLSGKKTLSILYAALLHDQLQWLGLLPGLARAEFDAVVSHALATGLLQTTTAGAVRVAPAATVTAAAARVPLPTAYQPQLGVSEFAPRFYLAVQVLSEASFGDNHYRPVTDDWPTQQWVRGWYRQVTPATAITALTAQFDQLPEAAADRLAGRLVGHDYVGRGVAATLAEQLQETQALALLVQQFAAMPPTDSWRRLWGGPRALLSPSNEQALALAQQGATRQAIGRQLRLKPSTVNEHLLTGAIFGATLPLAQLYSVESITALTALTDPQYTNYHALLTAFPNLDFFQMRLYHILTYQGRWPQHA